MSKFLNEKLSKVTAYVPGEQPQDKQYIKLNTNESPFPVSKRAKKLLKAELKKIRLYPDPDLKTLTETVALDLGVKPENVLMTNGSDEILNFAFMAFCDKQVPAVFADITYGFYKVFAEINDTAYRTIPLTDDFKINVTDYFNVNGTVFIANPNAPTGINISLDDVKKVLENNKDNVVVIDEAYVDFGGQSAVSLINEYDNLLVTRTFSKSRSMAGARLGFCVAIEKIIKDLTTVKYSTNPYNVNRLTASLGIASIKDDKYFKKCISEIVRVRDLTVNELKKLGFFVTDTRANFIFAKTEKIDGETLYKQLKDKGILVRYFSGERVKEFVRISVGTEKQMKSLILAIKEIIGE